MDDHNKPCKCGWNPDFTTSHIQYGKYICHYIKAFYDVKIKNGEMIYELKQIKK